MNASEAKLNEKYLTKSGIPVVIVRRDGEKVVLRTETTGNEITVEQAYPLQAFTETKINRDAKLLLKVNGKADGRDKRRPREGTLAQLIDPLLFEGRHTVAEIAATVAKRAPALAKGRDMQANVHCRIVVLRRKNHRLERDSKKHVKVIAPKA